MGVQPNILITSVNFYCIKLASSNTLCNSLPLINNANIQADTFYYNAWKEYLPKSHFSAIYINKNVNVRLYKTANSKFFTDDFEILISKFLHGERCDATFY